MANSDLILLFYIYSHNDLLDLNGTYAGMWQQQLTDVQDVDEKDENGQKDK